MEDKTSRGQAKKRILEAASEIVRTEGALALTLDAVAQQAGVSKGGLLYHFPSKDALVKGLLGHHLDQFEAALNTSGLPFAEAYVQLGSYDGSQGLISGMMAALALNPALLEEVRERWRGWYGRIPQQAGPVVAMLATDGLFMTEVLGMHPTDPQLKPQVLEKMLELAKGV